MTKVVQLSDEAYRLLTNAKRGRESYSAVVVRLLGGRDLADLEGLRDAETIARFEADLARVDATDMPGM